MQILKNNMPRIFYGVCALSLILTPTLSYAGNYESKPTGHQIWSDKEFYITTVHTDGKTSEKETEEHPAEAYSKQELPGGGGLIKKAPDANGHWKIRSFSFLPSQIIAYAGDDITLHFVGVQGPRHIIAIDGHEEEIHVNRGEMKSVKLHLDKPGIISFRSVKRAPNMQGQVIVLEKPHK